MESQGKVRWFEETKFRIGWKKNINSQKLRKNIYLNIIKIRNSQYHKTDQLLKVFIIVEQKLRERGTAQWKGHFYIS